jgi:hypothetical protein
MGQAGLDSQEKIKAKEGIKNETIKNWSLGH